MHFSALASTKGAHEPRCGSGAPTLIASSRSPQAPIAVVPRLCGQQLDEDVEGHDPPVEPLDRQAFEFLPPLYHDELPRSRVDEEGDLLAPTVPSDVIDGVPHHDTAVFPDPPHLAAPVNRLSPGVRIHEQGNRRTGGQGAE